MRRIYVTLGKRVEKEETDTADSGHLAVIDWDTKQIDYIDVVGRHEVTQGRSRGASGLDFFEKLLWVASRTDLIAFNPDTLKEVNRVELTPPYSIHQIAAHGDTLWLACMYRNMKQAVRNGKVVDLVPTRYSGIDSNQKPLGCFNALTWSPSGDEFHMYTGPEEIYNFSQHKIVVKGGLGTGPHDLCFLNDSELLFTRSLARELVLVNIETGEMRVVFSLSFEEANQEEWSFIGFMRGLEYDAFTGSVFVSVGPQKIYELNRHTWQVKDELDFYSGAATLEEKRKYCPFDIKLDPRDWLEQEIK